MHGPHKRARSSASGAGFGFVGDQNRLALDIGVPPRCINEIVLRKRCVSADTALRLGRCFDTTAQFWLGLQADFDVDVVSDALGDRLDREVRTPARRS